MTKETTLEVTISTKQRRLIDKVKDAINTALLNLEHRGEIIYWDIQEQQQ